MATESAMGDPPQPSWMWKPIFSPPNWTEPGPAFFPGSLPPNHDMSPAPAERMYGPVLSPFDKCPHCGKLLSE